MRGPRLKTGHQLADALDQELERHNAAKDDIRAAAHERAAVVAQRMIALEEEQAILAAVASVE